MIFFSLNKHTKYLCASIINYILYILIISTMTLTPHEAIAIGSEKRSRFISLIERNQELNQESAFQHLYISSRPGLGKTHSTKEILGQSEVPLFMINGGTSSFAFATALAVINYNNPALLSVNVVVDDCDSLLNDLQSINMLKNVLNRNGECRYEKSLSSQINYMTETQKAALTHFSIGERMGFSVPTHNMRFIFLSNIRLPTDDEVVKAAQKGTAKAILKTHQNAIRSRCRVLDIDLTPEEHFGWIADVCLNTDCLRSIGLSDEKIVHLLNYMWFNWSRLNERSIRTAEKMAETMISNREAYRVIWDFDFLK
jgi:hypothetical protein